MQLKACPRCGSRDLGEIKVKDLVLNNYTTTHICKECGCEGPPSILEKYGGVFQGIKSSVPGFIGPWGIKTQLDDGSAKILTVKWKDARDCIQSLDLKKGDKIEVTVDEKIWCIEKVS